MRFIICSQVIAVLIAATWVIVGGDPAPPIRTVAAAAGAAVGLTVGIAGFFRAMVVGAISIVAPISATGVLIPVIAGVLRGERPGAAQVAGMVAAIGGTMLAARPPSRVAIARREPGIGLACVSALGGGLWFWLMAPASRHSVSWTLMIVSAVPILLLAPVALVRRSPLRSAVTARSLTAIFASAVLLLASVALYAFATRGGELVIVSVLASLYPVITVMLAFGVLGERIYGAQRLGVVAVLTGVLLLSM